MCLTRKAISAYLLCLHVDGVDGIGGVVAGHAERDVLLRSKCQVEREGATCACARAIIDVSQ